MQFFEFLIQFWKYPFYIAVFLAAVFVPGNIMAYMENNEKYHKHQPNHWINQYGKAIALFVIVHYVLLVLIGLPFIFWSFSSTG